VAREMTFRGGQAVTADVYGSWRIRANSYDFDVTALNDARDLAAIFPDTPDFAFPAGRYALVLRGQAYDFTVDGAITTAAQCLERVESVNGAVYSECRNP